MGTSLHDEAIEAFFLGIDGSSWEEDQALLTLAEEVRVAVGGPPPRPDGALLAFLDDAARAASSGPTQVVGPTVSPAATMIRQPQEARTDRSLLSRRLRRAASIAAGLGIAAASVTVVGTTDVLSDPAMRAVARVVEVLTPFDLSESSRPPTSISPGAQPPTVGTLPATPGAGSSAPPPSPAGTSIVEDRSTQQPGATTPTTRPPVTVPTTVQGPLPPGSTGVDRAGQTPAAPFIPPFVGGPPVPSGDGTPPSTGLDRARETPAGGFLPPAAGGMPGRR